MEACDMNDNKNHYTDNVYSVFTLKFLRKYRWKCKYGYANVNMTQPIITESDKVNQ